MRIFKLLAFLFTLSLIWTLQSCAKDDAAHDSFAVSTIKTIAKGEKEFYFQLDDGKKMFPGIFNSTVSYTPQDGQRAFVIFKKLEEKVPGYEYNVEVKGIQNILTKEILKLTKENAREIGDDPINLTYVWISQGYVTIEFQYLGSHTENKKHSLNLVINSLTGKTSDSDEEYIDLEFRHNKNDDSLDHLGEGYVSFKLDEIAHLMKEKKGLRIRVKTIYNGIKFYSLTFPQK